VFSLCSIDSRAHEKSQADSRRIYS
jgi:hypothetical protein